MPLGVDLIEPAMWFELERAGIKLLDGQQIMLDAREIKNIDEISLLNQAAAMVDGVYHMIWEELKPGVRENDIVAKANAVLYAMGSDDVEAINAISGERCNPHPHNFTDRLIRPGDQAFFDILQSYMGYRTCYYRTFNVGRATVAQRDAYKRAREWLDASIQLIRPGIYDRQSRRGLAESRGVWLSRRDGGVRTAVRSRPWPGAARAADHLPPRLARKSDGNQNRHGVRARDLLSGDRRRFCRAHRGGSRRHRHRLQGDHLVPGGRSAHLQRLLIAAMANQPAPAARLNPSVNDDIGEAKRLALFRSMLVIRLRRAARLRPVPAESREGHQPSSLGQEAIAAGFAEAMQPGDLSFCTYRGHAHTLARGVPVEKVLGELMQRDNGLMRGKGGSMHLTSEPHGVMGSYAIVGAHLPIACGAAWRRNTKAGSDVSVCFFGDGTTNIGAFHEALNFAAIWKLPVVFVCENNIYMEYTPIKDVTAVEYPAADRARPMGWSVLSSTATTPMSCIAPRKRLMPAPAPATDRR